MTQATTTRSTTAHTAVQTSAQTPARTPAPRRRRANVALWVLQYVTAALYVFAALPKLTSNPQAVAGFDAIGFGDWFRYLIGTLELAGAVALLIPVLCGVAGIAFVGLMIGATITQITVFHGQMAAFPAMIGVVVAVIAWARRDRTRRLVHLVRTYHRPRAAAA